MRSCETGFVWSDAWLLLSLIYGRVPLRREDIRAIGDYINHAIFTEEELKDGLRRLSSHGHAQRLGKKYAVTPAVLNWYDNAIKGKSRTYVFKDLERVERFLGIPNAS